MIGLPQLYSNGTCPSEDNICYPGYNYTASNTAERYITMRNALQGQNRTIEYSICVWGYEGVEEWGNSTGNSWRISTDIRGEFSYRMDVDCNIWTTYIQPRRDMEDLTC